MTHVDSDASRRAGFECYWQCGSGGGGVTDWLSLLVSPAGAQAPGPPGASLGAGRAPSRPTGTARGTVTASLS
jgi:hypothetical protein